MIFLKKIIIAVFLFFNAVYGAKTSKQSAAILLCPVKKICDSFCKSNYVIEKIQGGATNALLFKIKHQNKNYILKIFPKHLHFKAFKNEILTHKLAEKIGIAPKIFKAVYCEKKYAYIIMSYEKGHCLRFCDLQNQKVLRNIGKTIAKIHTISSVKGFDIQKNWSLESKTHYRYRFIKKNKISVPSCYDDVYKKYIIELKGDKEPKKLCHGDLSKGNIIIGEKNRIFLIDWTSNAMDNPYHDIGFFIAANHLSKAQEKTFLQGYFRKKASRGHIKKVQKSKIRSYFLIASVYLSKAELKNQNLDVILSSDALKDINFFQINNDVSLLDPDKKKLCRYGLCFLKTYLESHRH
jgi:thiamine kinase-like enzyme